MNAMKATRFEFEQRFWIIGLIFFAGFSCYSIDPVNAGNWLQQMLFRTSSETARGRHELQMVFAAATLLVAVSALIRTWAAAYLKADVVHDAKVRTDSVVADGPYRYVRNPLYLALLLMTIGTGLLASRVGLVVLVLGIFLFQLRLIGREEHDLLETQGASYAAYRSAVPALFPSLRPRLAAGETVPRWGQAWLSESFFWGFTAAMGLFAVTLNTRLYYIVTGASLLGYVLLMMVWKRGAVKTEGSVS
jgi:protein-S-isoprenylcysteine O-methyltransferase Ste14